MHAWEQQIHHTSCIIRKEISIYIHIYVYVLHICFYNIYTHILHFNCFEKQELLIRLLCHFALTPRSHFITRNVDAFVFEEVVCPPDSRVGESDEQL